MLVRITGILQDGSGVDSATALLANTPLAINRNTISTVRLRLVSSNGVPLAVAGRAFTLRIRPRFMGAEKLKQIVGAATDTSRREGVDTIDFIFGVTTLQDVTPGTYAYDVTMTVTSDSTVLVSRDLVVGPAEFRVLDSIDI